jgi:polysaccharide pyruvyl transferase WcaK-like protein
VIGLVCDRIMLASAIDYLVQRSGMANEKKTNLRFRSREWRGYPGDVRISSTGKPAAFLPSRERMVIKDFFTPVRCRLCFDKMNVLSDITAGDPWGIPGIDMKSGESLVIARTQTGLEAVRLADKSGALTLREIPYEAILSGQNIDEKKHGFFSHCNAWNTLGRSLPDQAKVALSSLSYTASKGDFERNLQQGLSMDQYPSRNALVDGAQKWVRNKRLSKKVHKILRPLAKMLHQGMQDHSAPDRKGRMINIEILGARFKNKGAHLMLIAVVEKLSTAYPNARLAIRWKLKKSMKTGGLKLYKKPSESESFVGDLILRIRYSKRARKRKQLILDSEIDLVLDISGFQYSDKFGHGNIANRAKRMRKLKRAGKKVFLLPQGFGPFEAPRVQRAIHTVVDHAELIFARDQDSYDHMERLVGKRSNIVMSPDFTNLLKGTLPDKFTAKEARVCLIPNTQMIAKTSAEIGESYLPFLARCAIFLENADLNPFILLHETGKDTALAREIQKLSGLDLEIVDEKDPVNLKGIIGSCHFVIGSRYHALVSALSQGVPAVATSWSHKYERLYEDYDCKELLISNLDFETGALDVLEDLTDQENYRKIVLRLKEAGDRELQRTEQMWEQVIKAIGQKDGNDR